MNPATQSHVLMYVIATLPPEKVQEVVDFAIFLQRRYGDPSKIEYDDTWTEEDMRAFSAASLIEFDRREPADEGYDDVQTG